ncbi:MAG: DHH family phosphoesterase [Bacilli bacterium]|jgi:phosphoesterase RecJ-like protein
MRIQKAIYQKIKKASVITIFGHVRPDGDCYGSQIGLRDAIRATFPQKKVYAVGRGRPNLYHYFGEMDIVNDETIANSLVITVDIGDIPRLEDARVFLGKELIKIDHHIFTEPFGVIEWVDTNYVACGEMIAEFLFQFKFKIPLSAAKALFLAIASDSGRFQYEPTNSRTFLLVSKLADIGVDPSEVFQTIYVYEPDEVRRKHRILLEFQLRPGVAFILLKKEDLERLELTPMEATGYVNGLANMRGYPIWASFIERKPDEIMVELRSAGPNVQAIASDFGGGGHRKASGATLKSWAEVEMMLSRLGQIALEEPLEGFKENFENVET